MAITNSFRFPKGTDVSLTFTPVTVVSISGWTLQMNIKVLLTDASNRLTLDNAGNGGISITNASNGVFAVAITAAQTVALGVGSFVWDIWRTDNGANDLLASGTLIITGSVRYGQS